MNTQSEQLPRVVQVRKTRAGWNIQLDNTAWAELLTGLGIAIDVLDRGATTPERERAARLRALRAALSKTDRTI